jgi:hypothetical protein
VDKRELDERLYKLFLSFKKYTDDMSDQEVSDEENERRFFTKLLGFDAVATVEDRALRQRSRLS